MLVSRKIALLQVALICCFIGAIFLMASFVWGQSYLQLEQDQVKGNVTRAELAWEEELSVLSSLVGDWAPWDDLYSFANNPESQEFVEKNLPDAAMANLKINTAIVADQQGNIIFDKTIDLEAKEAIQTSPELLFHIAKLVRTGRVGETGNEPSVSGFVMTSQGPILLSIQQILTSEKEGPSPGYLVFGKEADGRLLRDISRRIQVETFFYSTAEMQAFNKPAEQGFYQEIIGDETIKTYTVMSDLFGSSAYSLITATPRVIYGQWHMQMKAFLVLVSGFGLLFIGFTLFLLNRVILSRLNRMAQFINNLIVDNNLTGRLSLGGRDELTDMSEAMNAMLDQIVASQKALQYISLHDALTGLYNRAYFEKQLQILGAQPLKSIGVICCDLDGLKLINDTLGHGAGDRLLVQAASIIRKAFDGSIIARVGGDEFFILMPGVNEGDVLEGCQRLKREIDLINQPDSALGLSLSIGWKYYEGEFFNETILHQILQQADDMMYRSKLSSTNSNRSAIVQGMLEMLKVRDFITEGHSHRMQETVVAVGKQYGLDEGKLNDLCLLAQFHDIGKVGISDRILFKPGPLSVEERLEMNRHSEIGHRIAQAIPELAPIADLILKHHEWWDGQGYPLGLKGHEIPIETRILSIADAYDAMTNPRPYRTAMSDEEALAELQRGAGTQFDPLLVAILVDVLGKEREKPSRAIRNDCYHNILIDKASE